MASRIYHQTSSTGESTTTSSSYQDKATLTFTPDASSTYLIIATWLFQAQGTGVAAYSQLYDATGSASLSEQIYVPKDTTDYISGGCAVTASFGSSPSSQTYKIQYKSDGIKTAAIKQARIIAIKLTANDQYASSTARSTYSTNTSYQDKVTKTFTASAGDYLILASAVMDHAYTTYKANARIDVDGSAQYGTAAIQVNNTDNRIGYVYFQKVALTAASHTIKLQYGTETSGRAAGIASAYLTILSVADLPALISASQDTPQTDTDATKDHALTADFSAAPAEDHIILACGLQSNASVNHSGSVGLYEGTTDLGTTLQEPAATDAIYPYFGSYFTADPADTYYVDVLAESAAYDTTVDDIRIYGIQLEDSVTSVTASDTLLLKFGTETGASPVGSISGTDTLLLKLGTESSSLNTTLSGADTLLLKYSTETGSLAASLSASDTLLLKWGTEYGEILGTVTNVSASDTLLLKFGTETGNLTASLSASDTLLLKLGTESSLPPAGSISGADTLLLKLGTETGSYTYDLSGTDTLLLKFGTETGGYTYNPVGADTLLLKYGTESSLAPDATLSGADTLLLKLGMETGGYTYDLSGADTLLLKYGTESSQYPAATITGLDLLLIDPDLEAVGLIASLSASDILLIDPDYDSTRLIGNTLGACEAPVRYIHAKVKITFSDPALNEAVEMLAEGGIAYNTDPTDTADNIIGSAYKWASCQECTLDGTYHPMPDSVGYWSTAVSDGSGDFSTPVDFTVYMTDARPIYDLKIYGDDKLDNYPVDFVITLYDADGVLLHTETVTGNASYAWTKTLDTYVNSVKSMKVSISKISKANRSCIITEFFTAYGEWYYRDKIMYLSVLEERDYKGGTLPIGNVSANELVLRLSNIDNHFSPDNEASPIYNLMKKNRRIEAWIGIEVPIAEAEEAWSAEEDEGSRALWDEETQAMRDLVFYGAEPEWIPLGIFWSQDWSVPQDEAYAEVVGLDRLELLRTTEFYSSQIYQNYTLYDLAEVVLQDAGLQASEYSIHADLDAVTIPYAWFGRTTHRTALIEIAEAALATVYCARDGKIVIDPYSDETSPSYTLSSDRYFTKDSPLAFSEIVNYVEVRATPRVLAASLSDIYTETETFSVPAAVGGVPGTTTRFCIFDTDGDPCMDVQTPTFTQSASGITIYSHTDYTWATEIVFQNASAVAENVTSVTIQGKILSKEGEKIAIAEDANSIRLNGKQALQEPVQNDFIQSKARAQDIADALLAAYKDPRRDVVIQARGYTMSELGERMTVQSLDGAFSDDYTITRQKLEYDGGMEVEMTGQRIPEGS